MKNLAIVAYFKDEAHILDEWIRHHLRSGIDHFYLVDNGSSDTSSEVISKHRQYITLLDGSRDSQKKAYIKGYRIAKKHFRWICFLDLDEFIYIDDPYKAIPDYLETVDSAITSIQVGWRIFLPNQIFQPHSVIEKNTVICTDDHQSVDPFKSIFRSSVRVGRIGHHGPRLRRNRILELHPDDGVLQINHYRFQSYEYLIGVKSPRGGGVHKSKYSHPAVVKTLEKYVRSGLAENHDLRDMSRPLIRELHLQEQIRPLVSDSVCTLLNRIASHQKTSGKEFSVAELFGEIRTSLKS